MKRVLTSLPLLALAIYAIFFAPAIVFGLVVVAMAWLCYYEYAGIAAKQGIEGPLWIGFPLGLLFLADIPHARLLAAVLLAFSLTLDELRKMLLFAAATALGLLYVFGAWRCAIDLHAAGVHWLLFALGINWVGDIAAFYVGRSLGKRKLAPRISPGKSWEGTFGSMVAAVISGLLFRHYLEPSMQVGMMIALSVLANIAGQIGDLAESAMKRGAGVKDSGTMLPGHGGFLDRLDSSLFTMPLVYYFLYYLSRAQLTGSH